MEVVVDVTRRRHVQVSGVARRARVRALGRRSAARLHAGISGTGKQATVGISLLSICGGKPFRKKKNQSTLQESY